MSHALVIGSGPAGLMAADALARAGHTVQVTEARPSVGRKLLMAGKSGLNLTKDETFETFLAAYGETAERLHPMLTRFGPLEVQSWAKGLGQEVFTGSSARVFPRAMKSSPLLRAWLAELAELSVTFHTKWRWEGWDETGLAKFDTPEGTQSVAADVTVLACGGASWARLGSDGKWAAHLPEDVAPFQPANMGFEMDWSAHMERHFGSPVKSVALHVGGNSLRGEFVISARGFEGSGIYAVSKQLREGANLRLDLMPDISEADVASRLNRSRAKRSLSNHLRRELKLSPASQALLNEFAHPLPNDMAALAKLIKDLPVPLGPPRPIDEAISVAGGLTFAALDERLMLQSRPSVFAAGEMLDWEAPTGGYLLTACLATGLWAGEQAAAWLRQQSS